MIRTCRGFFSSLLVVPARNKVAAGLDALQPEAGRNGSFQLVSSRHDFPDAWRRWERSPDKPLTLTFNRTHLPYAVQERAKVKSALVLWATAGIHLTDADIAAAPAAAVAAHPGDTDAWDISVPAPGGAREEAYLLVNYTVS